MNIAVKTNDLFVTVDGLNTRYFEEGPSEERGGVPAIMLHGSSLGSSADVFRRNVAALGKQGRAIAFDLPGLGLAERPRDFDYTWTGLGRWTGAAGYRRSQESESDHL